MELTPAKQAVYQSPKAALTLRLRKTWLCHGMLVLKLK